MTDIVTTTDAMRVTRFDAPPALETITLPAPAHGQVRLRIRACALNFADLLMCEGKYQDTPEPPFTLGLELSGEVTARGDGVETLSVGVRVAVYAGQGGLARDGNFDADRCIPLPPDLDHDTAAGLQIAYGTSHMALEYKARLQPGERLVVTGAAGGVGLTAVEIGKVMGAEVIAIARGADKLEIARQAGADHLIDADADDIRDQIKSLGGADVVYDAVGGDLYEPCFRATNPDGRILLIGFAGGKLPQVKPNHMLVKNITLIGFYWGGYLSFNPVPLRESLQRIFRWAAEGKIRPHISAHFALEDADQALDMLRARKSTGKVIVQP